MNNYDYKRLCPFKWFVLENFPFIEADFDALTNWQLCCKLGKEINKIINSVNSIGTQAESLTEYVTNYFDNLDVQEEINNKLDEMAESGELADIIAQYLQLQGQLCYNNAQEMQEATNLVNGSFAKTYGFYEYGDLGGAIYKIRTVTNQDTPNNYDLLPLANESLVAELIPSMPINPLQFGAKNNGVFDNTEVFTYIFSKFHNFKFASGTYLVNPTTSIIPLSNTKIELAKDATIKAIAVDDNTYNIIKLENISNVEIIGGIIEGERNIHEGVTGEWGMGISILNAENITLKDILIKDCWGDGLYINDARNLITENLIIDNCRRNGISVIKADNYHSINDLIKNINGTAPEAGIDIEPNLASDTLKNIIIDNLTTKNCITDGFIISLLNLDDTTNVDIVINNFHDDASTYGIQIKKSILTKGQIIFNNAYLLNNKRQGIRHTACYDSGLAVYYNKPTIINCNTDLSTDSNVAGISFNIPSTITNGQGNVHIIEPFITNAYASARYFVSRGNANVRNNNISLVNPRNNDTKKQITVTDTQNFHFKDENKMFIVSPVGGTDSNITGGSLYSEARNENLSTNYTYTLTNTLPIGFIIKIINLLENNTLSIKFPDAEYFKKYSQNAGYTHILNNYNDAITIQKISDTDWIEL